MMHGQVIFGPIIANSICDHFQFVMFYHFPLIFPFVCELLLGGHI
jgi:hypothetical protein